MTIATPPLVSGKAPLRILHHMARTGGTVISKCLGSMQDVVLLSEIHPLGVRQHNPLMQACEWFGLFSKSERDAMSSQRFTFVEAIELIRERVESAGKYLVIRDWTHLDFTGVPFLDRPPYRLTTAELLSQSYAIIKAASVRHPLDQWLSLKKLSMFQDPHRLDAGQFMHGYLRFSEFASEMGLVKYEDFVCDTDVILRQLCGMLDIPFDPSYKDRWATYNKITGDNTTPSGSRRVRQGEIKRMSRQSYGPDDVAQLIAHADYQKALCMLSYPAEAD